MLLRRGAREVVAVDVGYGQLVWRLQTDPRVHVHRPDQRPHARRPTHIGGPVDLVVADLSFISLTLVLPALTACAAPDADLVPMVKPQFEVGKDRLGAGGVVRDPATAGGGGRRRRPRCWSTGLDSARRRRVAAAGTERQCRVLRAPPARRAADDPPARCRGR